MRSSSPHHPTAHGRARPHRIAVPLDARAAAQRAAAQRAAPMVLIGPGLPLHRGGWVQQHQGSATAADDQVAPPAALLAEPPMSGWMLATVIVGAISGLCLFVFGACALAQVI